MIKKILMLALISLAIGLSVSGMRALETTPSRNAECSAANTIKKMEGVCECRKGFLWSESKGQCVLSATWCRQNYARLSSFNSAANRCECRKGFELNAKGNACVKAVASTEVTLDDSDLQNGSGQYDFETGKKTVYGSPDLFIGGIVFNGNWMPALNWQIVEMDKPFKEVTECPFKGYASVKNVDPNTGFGSPIYATPGQTYCLKTSEKNYAKIEILSASYDSGKDLRILKFRYVFQPNGTRKMP